MSLMKSYWILQNARVTAFIVFEWLSQNQQGMGWGGGVQSYYHPRLGLKKLCLHKKLKMIQ